MKHIEAHPCAMSHPTGDGHNDNQGMHTCGPWEDWPDWTTPGDWHLHARNDCTRVEHQKVLAQTTLIRLHQHLAHARGDPAATNA